MSAPSSGIAIQPELVLNLPEVDSSMLPIVGGKAANLGEMIHAGLPVPPGFCVTTEAYRQVAASANIDYDALAVVGSKRPAESGPYAPSDHAGGNGVEVLALRAREALLGAAMPRAISRAVVESYQSLGENVPVAVRSSATAEDLPFASFAGQQDTYLHIIGTDAVIDAVRRCWASLWTERAVVYRTNNGIDHRAVRLAVVVQRMVDSKVAGVLFTANPITGRRRQAVLDANPGLGEAVVSGAVNPDHFVVDTDGRQILERRLGDKRVEVRSLPGGGTERVEKSAGADRACLTDDQILALAALGDRVEKHFGAPQDIEWAIDSAGKLWLTQSRPITTLFPLPKPRVAQASKPGEENLRAYLCFSLAQGLTRPITPMGLAGFRLLASAVARLLGFPVEDAFDGPAVYAEAGQRVFIDLTGVLRSRVGRALMPRVLDVMESRSAVILRTLLEDPRLSIVTRSRLPFLRRVQRITFRYGIPAQVIQALARPDKAHARAEELGAELRSRLRPRNTTAAGHLNFAEQVLNNEIVQIGPNLLPLAASGLAMLALAGRLLGKDASEADLQISLRGLPRNVTTEMNLALWELAKKIRSDESAVAIFSKETPAELARHYRAGTLPPSAQEGIAEFLALYGHRAIAEIDLGMPRWSEDPTHILGVLANYLRLENPELAPDAVFARGTTEANAMVETLTGRARRRGRLRAKLVRFALNRARQLAGLREIPKYYIVVALAAARRELAAVGAGLAASGKIEKADDVFFLNLVEARAALNGANLREVVKDRRQGYEAELRRKHIPRVILSDGTEPERRITGASNAAGLSGTPASPGVVTGIARVVLDPNGAHLEPGEILVAPSTDPGWTPLFLTAGGLVMEMGGANSHGAVVAREYGIPAVVGVAEATTRVVTGQKITVDGGGGTVTL